MVKPLTRRRASQALDTSALAQAVARPGIDPRTWVTMGVVIEVGWDNGFVVVVRIAEGALCGEEVACDVAVPFASALTMATCPIEEGDFAVCVVPGGDANNMPIVIGFLHTGETRTAKKVNDLTVDANLVQRAVVVSNAAVDAELSFGNVRLTAEQIRLGPGAAPTQPFVRGRAFVDALEDFLDALDALVGTPVGGGLSKVFTDLGAAASGPLLPLAVPFGLAVTALGKFKTAIKELQLHLVQGDALSDHITGE